MSNFFRIMTRKSKLLHVSSGNMKMKNDGI